MQALSLFKLVCFIFAAITAFNLYIELGQAHISIGQVLTHGGLLMILLEFGFKSQLAAQSRSKTLAEAAPKRQIKTESTAQASSYYHHIFSKIGLLSIFSSLILQSLSS